MTTNKAPPSIHVAIDGETVPQRNYKIIQNMAGIEIAELREALQYAEFQLAKNMKEKETLEKEATIHTFQMKEAEDKFRGAENDKQELKREIDRAQEKVKMLESEKD